MPLTATLEDITAYQEKVQKNKITPFNLPSCRRCNVDSAFFKLHAYRERRFLIIIKMFIQTVFFPLLRFKCPGCGKTYTYYPDFAIPHKHYTRQTIMNFSEAYVKSEHTTYEKSTMVDLDAPGYPDDSRTLSGSTIHRWITTVSGFSETARKALDLVLQESPSSAICRTLAGLTIPKRKYRTVNRKNRLLSCRRFLLTEAFFQSVFQRSIFTKLATGCHFS